MATTTHRPTRTARGLRWRAVDIVVASVIGVAASLIYFAWKNVYDPITKPLSVVLPGSQALLYGIWLFAGVLGALVIRKPGVALFTELVAAVGSALLGAVWGVGTIEAGLVQGFGAEIVFAVFLYANWGIVTAMLAGAASGIAMAVNNLVLYYPGPDAGFQIVCAISAVSSGVFIAGLGSWALARAPAKTGALSRFAAGRDATALV